LAGPCFSVIFPEPASIFLTSPLMLASWAAVTLINRAAASTVAPTVRMIDIGFLLAG
jgi:hypothetical protein